MRPATEGVAWLVFLVSLYLLVRCGQAHAEEPCRRAGDDVVCTAAGFKVLTDTLVDTQTAVGICRFQLKTAESRVESCRRDCVAIVPPAPPAEPVRTSAGQALTGAFLIAAGAASIAFAALLPEVDTSNRGWLAVGGLTGLSLGVALVLP